MALDSNIGSITVTSSVPAWFSSLAERTWTDIAGGSAYSGSAWQKGARLSDVDPGVGDQTRLVKSYSGKSALQSYREYLSVAQPGHSDYSGNEIYALALGDDVPAWKRIWGPTPAGQFLSSSFSWLGSKVTHADGAPRTCHGWFSRVSSDGPDGDRLWTLATNNQPSGGVTSDVWSIPRASLGVGVYDPSLWTYHGKMWADVNSGDYGGSSFLNQAFPSCWDKIGNQLWVSPEADVRPTGTGVLVRVINVTTCLAAGDRDSSGPLIAGATTTLATAGNPSNGWSQSWSVVASNASPRCILAYNFSRGELGVWNLESPSVWRFKTVTGGSLPGKGTCNAYYNATNRKIVLGGNSISTLVTIAVPSDPWNASSGFTYGTIPTAGGSVSSSAAPANESNSSWQVINDMGNGQACVVMQSRLPNSPCYVYKLPVTF